VADGMGMSVSCSIMYVNLGPYHVARLRALAAVLPKMHAVELAAVQGLYPWRPSRDELGFSLTTLFPGRASETVPAAAQRSAIRAALSEINPALVVVAVGAGSSRSGDTPLCLHICGRTALLVEGICETPVDAALRGGCGHGRTGSRICTAPGRRTRACLSSGQCRRQRALRKGF